MASTTHKFPYKSIHFNYNNRGLAPANNKHRDQVLYCLENHQVLILVEETGCDISTEIPQNLYEFAWYVNGLIGITEPRKQSAVTTAERLAEELGESVGKTVGLSVEFLEHTSAQTKIKYLTEGVLLREMLADPLLTKYAVIMVDKTHQRSVLCDLLLGCLKKIIKKRSSLKLIISCAAVDATHFQHFFDTKSDKTPKKNNSIVLTYEERLFPVQIFYRTTPCTDYIEAAVETTWNIHKKETAGDVLVFLTDADDVSRASNLLYEYKIRDKCKNLHIFPIFGAMSHRDKADAFYASSRKGTRKVVLSTKVAETSMTIPGIVYVVDCGFTKIKYFDAEQGCDNLIIIPISKSIAIQRAGRAACAQEGKAYRLYSESDFAQLPDRLPADLRHSKLGDVILHLKALGISNIFHFDFPSPPPTRNVLSALSFLSALDAIDDKGNLTKPIGYFLTELPFNPILSKMLIMSDKLRCSEEIIIIIAMLTVDSVFLKPASGTSQGQAHIAKRHFEAAEGDLITLLNVYTAFTQAGAGKDFCGRHYLDYHLLKQVQEVHAQIKKIMVKTLNMELFSCNGDIEPVCKCIIAGMFTNAVYLHHSGAYKRVRSQNEVFVHPSSTVYTMAPARFLVYYKLIKTTKYFINLITVIKEEWLSEMAPHCYQKTKKIS